MTLEFWSRPEGGVTVTLQLPDFARDARTWRRTSQFRDLKQSIHQEKTSFETTQRLERMASVTQPTLQSRRQWVTTESCRAACPAAR